MSERWNIGAAATAACLLALWVATGWAQAQQPAPAEPAATEEQNAEDPRAGVMRAVGEAMVPGPTTIDLGSQARMALPAGYGFVPPKEGAALLEAMGNQTDQRFLGLVLPTQDGADWFVAIDFEDSGYVEDSDAKDWDADELLTTLREGTEEGNKRRAKMGITGIEVTRWIEKPAYDAAAHRLVWSAEIREKGGQDPDPGVNYNTYVLGREGYISMNLVTSVADVEAHKPAARELLAAVSFNDGKRYSDFNSSTDKVAAYGLAALVGGIAAKKLGLVAVILAFLAKSAKFLIIGGAALLGGLAKFFKGRTAG